MMKSVLLAYLILVFINVSLLAQSPADTVRQQKYWVSLLNKDTRHFSLSEPHQFLSERAIRRRTKQGISIDTTDFPVSPIYLDSIKATGATVRHTSRWLNGVAVMADNHQVNTIASFSFVNKVRYMGPVFPEKVSFHNKVISAKKKKEKSNYYGKAATQIEMIGMDSLHQLGYRGENMLIAVLDGGFINVLEMPFFDSLHIQNRLLHHQSFLENDTLVFGSSTHGSQVLSVMAAELPGVLVGSAPKAQYVCLKTEDSRGEHLAEESNWVAAIELADSMGVDVVNSSLGYNLFWDTTMNYTYAQMDGTTSIATRAGDIAFSKGMIVVTAAGNEGNNSWKYIDVPADGVNVLSVGAVGRDKKIASFSSLGPTADGRIKPEVVALGRKIAVASVYSDQVNYTNGTSFSSPLICGAIACLWQAFPDKTNREIIDAVLKTASQATQPDNVSGFGIPNMMQAYQHLKYRKQRP